MALVFGFALPGGFYLWGAALALHGPFVQALRVHLMHREGIDALVGGARDVASYVGLSGVVFVFTILCYTALSSAGAGVLWGTRLAS